MTRPFSNEIEYDQCEKCGRFPTDQGRIPRYEMVTIDGAGILRWPCPTCGHEIISLPKDAAGPS